MRRLGISPCEGRLHRTRSGPFDLSVLLQLQDMLSHDIEPLFNDLTEQRITLLSGQCRGELGPVLSLQSLDRGRKEVPLLHRHMAALVPNEVANDAINSLA